MLNRLHRHRFRLRRLRSRLREFPARVRELPDQLREFPARFRELPDQLRGFPARVRALPARLGELPSIPALDHPRIDVIRHRVASRLDGRHRMVVVAMAVLAGLGLVTVAANATAPGTGHTPSVAADTGASGDYAAALERRAATERSDRAAREQAATPDESSRGTAAVPSPTPTEEEAEPEEEPEPAETKEAKQEEPKKEEPPPDWVHPMPGAATTSCYGWRWGALHGGVDLAAPQGTPIQAVGAGRVTHAGWVFGGYGISVVIDHGGGVSTHYAHASQANVSVGDQVSPGQTVALEGSTGDSSGPHLHFEVHVGGLWNQVEPTGWLRDRGVTIGGC